MGLLVFWGFCQHISSETLNKISWKIVVIKNMLCRCTYLQIVLIQSISLGIMPPLILEIWSKIIILLKQFVSAKPLNRIFWNVVVFFLGIMPLLNRSTEFLISWSGHTVYMCIFTGNSDLIFIQRTWILMGKFTGMLICASFVITVKHV